MHGGKAAMTNCFGISSVRSLPFFSISSCFRRSTRTVSSCGRVMPFVWSRFSMCVFTSSSRSRHISFFVTETLPFVICRLMSFHSFSRNIEAFLR